MKIAFYTLGCKVNQYESQVVGELLIKAGHSVVASPKEADCVIINSCTVTAESDRKTRQAVRRFRKLLPEGIIILAGCMSQAFPEKAAELLEADIVTGNVTPEKIPDFLDAFIKNRTRIVDVAPHTKCEKYTTPPLSDFTERTRAFMKVEDGCDRWCTYCIIPKARGEIRSRKPEDITAEAERLAQKGFSEIVLVGINLTSYGKECGMTICDAVSAAAVPEGIKRVRLGSLEPDHISDETLYRLAAEPKFCPQFHLALQSGCDRTLKRMNRHYDTEFYRDLVKRIRNKFSNPSITTDIMVGFAGETEDEFEENLAFLREIGFARAHVFAYSRREGTIAAALPTQVSGPEKDRRAALMGNAAADGEAAFLASQVGQTATVLFETCKDGFAEGYTENYTRVKLPTTTDISGKILKVKIIESREDYCIAKTV
jgi:threonylcarbamoyladenosine tRNA methylthiotransferase MtaB